MFLYIIFSIYVYRALVNYFIVPPNGPVRQSILEKYEVMAHVPTAKNAE